MGFLKKDKNDEKLPNICVFLLISSETVLPILNVLFGDCCFMYCKRKLFANFQENTIHF